MSGEPGKWIGPELWQRVETLGVDTGFRWAVWTSDGSQLGDMDYFEREDDARARLDAVERAISGSSKEAE